MESRLRVAAVLLIASLAAVVLVLPTGVALGQPNDDPGAMSVQARKHLELGLTHYQARDYEEAIREFRAGYVLDPRPELLFAMAQAERLSGDCRSAITAYEKFLEAGPPEQQAAAARDAVERCKIALGSGMRGEDDDERAARDEPSAPAATAEPAASPTAASPVREVAASGPAANDSLRRPWYRDKVGATLLGVGVASAAVGLGFYVASSSDEAAADGAPTYGEYEDLLARAEKRRTIAWAGIGAGTALVGGAALWYLLRDDDRADRRPAVGLSVTEGGAAVFYNAEF